MKTHLMIRKNNTLNGRLARKAGAVMMEYVLVAVLIAAGAVVAIVKLGEGVVDSAGIATNAVVGDHGSAETNAGLAHTAAATGVTDGATAHGKYHK